LDVFSRDASGWYANESDIIAGIQWAITNKDAYNVCAINMSLGGGGPFASACPNDAMGVAIGEARRVGILSAVAAGNDGFSNGLSTPACAPGAVSVGATYDGNLGPRGWAPCADSTTYADKMCCFSNSASYLSVIAPGAEITAGGRTYGGTSQATPHIAGAGAWVALCDSRQDGVCKLFAAAENCWHC